LIDVPHKAPPPPPPLALRVTVAVGVMGAAVMLYQRLMRWDNGDNHEINSLEPE
jgi:hypothetical protein